MTQEEKKTAYARWLDHGKQLERLTSLKRVESPQEKKKNIARAMNDYEYFCQRYLSHYCQCPNASFHNKAAKLIEANKELRAVFKWPRGHAKSVHMDVGIPLWLKFKKELHVMVLVGKSEDNADSLLGDLQSELQFNQYIIEDFGIQYNAGCWQEGEFVTKDLCAFFSRGRGQSPRGLRFRENRPDYIVIDDLDDDELCRNESRVNDLVKWVKEALFGCFGGRPGRFIMVGNLISKNSVLQKMIDSPTVQTSSVNAIDKNGNPSWPQCYTKELLKDREEFMGYRAYQKEYMNNPITEGAVFQQRWIKWKHLPALKDYESIIMYLDPSWKSTGKNDYKAARMWGRPKVGLKGYNHNELHNIKTFCRQCGIHEMVSWLYDVYEWVRTENAAATFFMEANFMQDTILDEFEREGDVRGYQLPIMPDRRKKPDKYARIEANSALWERGYIWYNEDEKNDPDMKAAIDQTLAFEKGSHAHDDAPDADEGAIWFLQREVRNEKFAPSFGMRDTPKGSW